MTKALSNAAFPVLRNLDPERAHRLALRGLRLGLAGTWRVPDDPALRVRAFGCEFRNPIGLAAGFDKDAVALRGLARLGFGFIETGTVTPRPQRGNPRPRVFRLGADEAIINRLGFNNKGITAYRGRLASRRGLNIPVGANLGINKDRADPERDYPEMVAAVADLADYVVINVSSPNTPGLRDLQAEARLRAILVAISARQRSRPPLLVKVAPDLSSDALRAIIETCVTAGVDGLVVSNTTTSRPPSLQSRARGEEGGLSGRPLFTLSTAMLARSYQIARGRLALVGVGGVTSGQDALAKIQAGARLVQLYTAFAHGGPGVVARIVVELGLALRRAGFSRIEDAVGTEAGRWANAAGGHAAAAARWGSLGVARGAR